MTTSTNQKPAAKLRDGAIVATLWKKQGEHGVFYNTTIARTYKEGDIMRRGSWKRPIMKQAKQRLNRVSKAFLKLASE